jgi:hypothetical protein
MREAKTQTGINVKPSNRRPAANSIIQPGFKFQDMGIGGLPSNQCFTSSRRSIKQEALDVLNTKFFDQARGENARVLT